MGASMGAQESETEKNAEQAPNLLTQIRTRISY